MADYRGRPVYSAISDTDSHKLSNQQGPPKPDKANIGHIDVSNAKVMPVGSLSQQLFD